MFKKLLRKILPSPAETVNRRFDQLEKLIKDTAKLLAHESDFEGCPPNSSTPKDRLSFISEQIHVLDEHLSAHSIVWSNAYERDYVRKNWSDLQKGPAFAQKYLDLIRGLDQNSIQVVTRVLSRCRLYLSSDITTKNLFSQQEQQMIRDLNDYFYPEILELSDHLFAYRHYLLPINYFEPGIFYYRAGLDEFKTLQSVKGKAIIDVGAYIGDSALLFADIPDTTVYSFEAVPENFLLLQETIQLNHLENVVAENIALGSEEGTISIHVDGACSTTRANMLSEQAATIEVPVTTLDRYVAQHQLRVGMIKVDIEGGEPEFLAGAMQTIQSQKPILYISIYHNTHDFFEIKPMIERMGLGYTFQIYKPVFRNATSEVALIAEILDTP